MPPSGRRTSMSVDSPVTSGKPKGAPTSWSGVRASSTWAAGLQIWTMPCSSTARIPSAEAERTAWLNSSLGARSAAPSGPVGGGGSAIGLFRFWGRSSPWPVLIVSDHVGEDVGEFAHRLADMHARAVDGDAANAGIVCGATGLHDGHGPPDLA